ncbi:MAG: hypothetical protein ACI9EW_000682 [Cellvibrionaceae bacterium]|jgi:hypothetical protein
MQTDITPTVYIPPLGDGTLQYVLDWELGKTIIAPDNSSWSAETETGYTVTITEGVLTSATVQWVDCVESQTILSSSMVSNLISGFVSGFISVATVTRDLGTIFNTANFVSMSDSESDSELTRSILRQLTETATFSITSNK